MSRFRFFSLTLACCLIFGFGLFGCTSPNGTSANSDLEAQVLEIIRKNPQVIIESVQAYQETQQNDVQQARQAFLQQMSTNPGAIIGNSPVKGAAREKYRDCRIFRLSMSVLCPSSRNGESVYG